MRFKEVGLWSYDEKRYFTNTSQKYLMYDNLDPWRPGKERRALITALILGKILNRILILPKFSCFGCVDMHLSTRVDNECAFNALFHVKSFDSYFTGKYREQSFLKHPYSAA